ncbi:uncharacterized protein LOC132555987 [Ylistrum balloti]|uniref:uncharacterized protein LOC132555987 n=1 Tax=Ylistrum balloti TaxID=509963 RepID=UPI002905967A|nr:uncharacterized protein LOC132555987 [Ylistrum balloti]
MTDQLYKSLHGLTTIVHASNKLDAIMNKQLFQYLGTQPAEKMSFFSFMDKLMQPLEYKLFTIETFVNEQSDIPLFVELRGIRKIEELSVQNLIKLLSEFDTNFNISFNEIREERNIVAFYLKMFSSNALSSDAEILCHPHHPKYIATYTGYQQRAEKFPRTWRVVMRMIYTKEGLRLPNVPTILLKRKTRRPTEDKDLYKPILSKLKSARAKYYDPDTFRLKLATIFYFTLQGVDWAKNTCEVIQRMEGDIMRLAKDKDWLAVQYHMYTLINTYERFVRNLRDFDVDLNVEHVSSYPDVEKLSESCVAEFHDLLNILGDILHTIEGQSTVEHFESLTNDEIQLMHNESQGFQNPTMSRYQEHKLLPLIKAEFDIGHLEDWMRSRVFLYEELLRHSNEKRSVSYILESLEVYVCQYGGAFVTLDELVSPEEILCTLSTLRMDFLDYDSYSFHVLREKCGSSKYSSTNLCDDIFALRKDVLLEQEVRVAVDSKGINDVGFICDEMYNKIRHDAMLRKYRLTVSKIDILQIINRLYPEKQQFGFYPMSVFRQNSQPVSEEFFARISSFAIDQRNAEMTQILRNYFCDNHGFCVEHKTSLNESKMKLSNDRAHVVYNETYTAFRNTTMPRSSARTQTEDQVSLAPIAHVNNPILIILLVCNFAKQIM